MFFKVQRLHPDAQVPHFAYPGDAGADLAVVEGAMLAPGEAKDLPVGIAVECPVGFWFDIRPRSSTLRRRGLYVHPGLIDGGYRGPLFIYVRNDSGGWVRVEKGERLAQMVFLPLVRPEAQVVDELEASDRGDGGFGSTGQ